MQRTSSSSAFFSPLYHPQVYACVGSRCRKAFFEVLGAAQELLKKEGGELFAFRDVCERCAASRGGKLRPSTEAVVQRLALQVFQASDWKQLQESDQMDLPTLEAALEETWLHQHAAGHTLRSGDLSLQQRLCQMYLAEDKDEEDPFWMPLRIARDIRRSLAEEVIGLSDVRGWQELASRAAKQQLNEVLGLGYSPQQLGEPEYPGVYIEVEPLMQRVLGRFSETHAELLERIVVQVQAGWRTLSPEEQSLVLDHLVGHYLSCLAEHPNLIGGMLLPEERSGMHRQIGVVRSAWVRAQCALEAWQQGGGKESHLQDAVQQFSDLSVIDQGSVRLCGGGLRPDRYLWSQGCAPAERYKELADYLFSARTWCIRLEQRVEAQALRHACTFVSGESSDHQIEELTPFGVRVWLMALGVLGIQPQGDGPEWIGAPLQESVESTCRALEVQIEQQLSEEEVTAWREKCSTSGWSALQEAPLEVRSHPVLMREAMRANPLLLQFVAPSLQTDLSWIASFAQRSHTCFFMLLRRLPVSIRQDRSWLLQLLRALYDLSPRSTLMESVAAVSDDQLRKDPSYVLQVMELGEWLFYAVADPELQRDRTSMCVILAHYPRLILEPPRRGDPWRRDSTCMKVVARQNGSLLGHMDPVCWRMVEVVATALLQTPKAFAFAEKTLKCLEGRPATSYLDLTEREQQMPLVAEYALRRGLPFASLHSALQSDKTMALQALWHGWAALSEIPEIYTQDPAWLGELVDGWRKEKTLLEQFEAIVPATLRGQSQWMMERIKRRPSLMQYVDAHLQQDEAFVREALLQSATVQAVLDAMGRGGV